MNINIANQVLNVVKNIERKSDKIPTRFDDIINDIAAERMEKYYRQNNTSVTSTYTLGSVLNSELGNLLNKVV